MKNSKKLAYQELINASDQLIIDCTTYLELIRKSLDIKNDILLNIEQNKKKYTSNIIELNEIEKFNSYYAFVIIALLDLSVAMKNLCLVKSDWEIGYFVKYAYLTIHETINKLNPRSGVSFIKQTVDSKYPDLKSDYDKILYEINEFKNKPFYKDIERTRHHTAGHIDKNIRLYYDTVYNLSAEIAGQIIISFHLSIIDNVKSFFIKYQDIANEILLRNDDYFKKELEESKKCNRC